MANSKSVMKYESIDLRTAWISDVPISVKDGRCTVDIIVATASAPGVWNEPENTKVVFPDSALPPLPGQKQDSLSHLIEAESTVSAKHFIVTTHAREYLDLLNKKIPGYTDDLVKRTNLFCAELNEKKEFKTLPLEYQIEVAQPDNKKLCEEISAFQQNILPYFRKLSGEENIRKIKERYALEAFNDRVNSPEIKIFIVRKAGRLLGTFTLNLHTTPQSEQSKRFGYLSDLFVAEKLEDDPDFINQFFGSVFSNILKTTEVRVLSVMAAAGDPTIPIVKCFTHATKVGLIEPFTQTKQENLGVVAQFTPVDEKFKNKRKNFPRNAPPPPVLCHLSFLSSVHQQPISKSAESAEKLRLGL